MDEFKLFTSLRFDPALATVPGSVFTNAGWNYEVTSNLYMLDYHRDRLLRAAKHWGWDAVIARIEGDQGLKYLEKHASQFLAGKGPEPLRFRIIINREGDVRNEVFLKPPTPLANLFPSRLPPPGTLDVGDVAAQKEPAWTVYLDLGRTARSEYTHYKTTQRAMYDDARARAGVKGTFAERKEVLIINEKDDAIMEGSATTPYFWRSGRWVTPPVSVGYNNEVGSGGQDGTSRRWALGGEVQNRLQDHPALTEGRGIAVEEVIKPDSVGHGEEVWLSNGVEGFVCGKVQVRMDGTESG